MQPRRRTERGITVVELMIALGIFAILVVPLSALIYQGQMARKASQESLYSQQEGAVVLSRFTDDVRGSTYLTSPLSQTSALTMRHPTSLTSVTYLTWRLQDGKLQRGESASATTAPTTWQDVVDPGIFTVESGRFAYYTLNNGVPKSNDEARRLELRDLVLHSKSTNASLKPPAVSAVMREPAQARALTSVGPWTTWGDDRNWHDAVWAEFQIKNQADKDLSFGSFSATWDDQASGGYIKAMDFKADNTSDWGGGQGEYRSGTAPVELDRPLLLGSDQTATVKMHFMAEKPIESFTLVLFEAADTAHRKPYVLKVK